MWKQGETCSQPKTFVAGHLPMWPQHVLCEVTVLITSWVPMHWPIHMGSQEEPISPDLHSVRNLCYLMRLQSPVPRFCCKTPSVVLTSLEEHADPKWHQTSGSVKIKQTNTQKPYFCLMLSFRKYNATFNISPLFLCSFSHPTSATHVSMSCHVSNRKSI